MADTNLEMSKRNDKMTAHRGVVAFVEHARRDCAAPNAPPPPMRDTALQAAAYPVALSMQLERRRVDRNLLRAYMPESRTR
jgi:hypothetical protein